VLPIGMYVYERLHIEQCSVYVFECIYEQSKTLENLLRVFVCDVISFLLFFCAQRLRERKQERHLTGVNYLPPLSIREKKRMNDEERTSDRSSKVFNTSDKHQQ
jgi:hypothetical protein